ncbi:MAG: FAD-dependent oxidoreductase [Candidatus Liptonbacteria bacterium]|nr:FAD-dependent oxidoreductase [Candidatus Liptonbacteria bacterium]
MYDLLIIGGGPGGVAAGIYAARKKIKAVLVTDTFGGQSLVSTDVQNWVGTKSVSGFDLGKMLEEHLRAQEDIEIVDSDVVVSVKDEAPPSRDASAGEGKFIVTTKNGKMLESKYLLIASGSRRRKLGVTGEHELDGKGVAYCSTCDAPLFKGKTVAVVGGGNSGLEAVGDLLPYAAKIYLLERGERPKGDPVTLERIQKSEKFSLLTNMQVREIFGDAFVKGLKYADTKSGEMKELAVEGVFVEIGAVPNSEFVKNLVALNKFGEIVVDHKTQRTSHPRIWAVGDVSDVRYKQNNISAGDAVKGILNIYEEIQK